ncbi:MAG TPA: OstA-like protein [Salinivirgaceae bacterium]|nr:OstA-like protein [Salinivirgaceae bacterium]
MASIHQWIGFTVFLILFLANDQILSQTANTKITLKRADIMVYNEKVESNARRLIGNVVLQQEDILMYCDSVYFYNIENNIKAFSRVKLIKADSIKVFSDYLFHYGEIKRSEFRNNVVLRDNKITIYTDSLNYDFIQNRAYYFNGGKIIDSTTTLSSETGYYYAGDKLFFFNKNVVVEHENYRLYTDSLKYEVETGIIRFEGPTTMVNDTITLFAKKGWYNTKTKKSNIWDSAQYFSLTQKFIADTILFDRVTGIGEGFNRIRLTQIKDSIILSANYARYNQNTGEIYMTKRAFATQIIDGDSIHLHGKNIFSYQDTIDSTVFRKVLIYPQSQLFGPSIQMRSDSVAVSMKDSVIQLFNKPIIWLENMQLTADFIELHISNSDLREVHLYNNALISNQHDSIHFDQIKGNTIICYLKNRKLERAKVDRRAEVIYYITDKDRLTSMNNSICRNISIYFSDDQIDQVVFHSKPEGKVLPMEELDKSNMYFRNFKWFDHLRPKKFEDIFDWKQ